MTIFRDNYKQDSSKYKKGELRAIIKAELKRFSSDATAKFSRSVFGIIESTAQFKRAKTIALYSALLDELPTSETILRWAGTKRIALPVVDGDEMSFFEFTPEDTMTIGAFGISEPTTKNMISPSDIDLIIVPGVAFDKHGNRLGRGKGYYDKYLSHTNAYRIGICTPIQLVDELACEPHDQRMNAVVTPLGVIELPRK